MANSEMNTYQSSEAEATAPTEATRPGRVVAPAVDIFESSSAITLLADLPGVAPEQLKVDLDEGVLTISAPAAHDEAEGESDVIREYHPGVFQRQFTLADTIDQERIEARVSEGVLRLTLPKADRVRTRKIEVVVS